MNNFTQRHGAAAVSAPIPEPWTSIEMLLADAARYRWLLENHEKWSWNPTRYNPTRISGFACNGTGYLGHSLAQAVDLAMTMKEEKN